MRAIAASRANARFLLAAVLAVVVVPIIWSGPASATATGSGTISFALINNRTGGTPLRLPAPVVTQYFCEKTIIGTPPNSEPAIGIEGTLGSQLRFDAFFSATQTILQFNNTSDPPMYGAVPATFTAGKRAAGTVQIATKPEAPGPWSGTLTVDLTCDVAAGSAVGTPSTAAAKTNEGSSNNVLWPWFLAGVALLAGLGAFIWLRARNNNPDGSWSPEDSTTITVGEVDEGFQPVPPPPFVPEGEPTGQVATATIADPGDASAKPPAFPPLDFALLRQQWEERQTEKHSFDIPKRIADLKERRKSAAPEEAEQIDEYIALWEEQMRIDALDAAPKDAPPEDH